MSSVSRAGQRQGSETEIELVKIRVVEAQVDSS